MKYYLHNVPGRLRVRIPDLKDYPCKALTIKEILEDLEGITSIKVTPLTGSVVVEYDERRLQSESILNVLRDHEYFDENHAACYDPVQYAASKAGKAVGKALFSWAVGKAFEGSAFSFIAVLI